MKRSSEPVISGEDIDDPAVFKNEIPDKSCRTKVVRPFLD